MKANCSIGKKGTAKHKGKFPSKSTYFHILVNNSATEYHSWTSAAITENEGKQDGGRRWTSDVFPPLPTAAILSAGVCSLTY